MVVPPFQFPFPQVTTWKLLVGATTQRTFTRFFNNSILRCIFGLSCNASSFQFKQFQKVFSMDGKIILSDGILIDGGNCPS